MDHPFISARPRPGAFSTPIFPAQANHYGTLFAGEALSLMSRAAVLAAAERALGDVVMAGCGGISFSSPVKVGEVLNLDAQVIRTGRASITVSIAGTAGPLGLSDPRPVMEGLFQMVAVDEGGRPRPIRNTKSQEQGKVRA